MYGQKTMTDQLTEILLAHFAERITGANLNRC